MIPAGCVYKCRGCKHREWSMAESLAQKYTFVQSKLKPWADKVEPVRSVEEAERWGYRSKTTLSANFNGNNWEFGMWARDELISIPYCPIHSSNANKIFELIRENIPQTADFRLAFIVLSRAQLVLVLKTKVKPSLDWVSEGFSQALKEVGIEGFWIHLNPSAGKRIFEKTTWHLLWGSPRSTDYNGLLYGPAAFQQLIPKLYNQSLYETLSFFGLNSSDAVVDLYCGTGNSMNCWVKVGAKTIGVEQSGDAVDCAKVNIPEAIILRGACRQRIPQVNEWVLEQRNSSKRVLLYANPPRTGLEPEVLSWIVKDGLPSKIAYLSCSPGTLYKNLIFLTEKGYKLNRVIPFDFFPQTIHVECLALLEL